MINTLPNEILELISDIYDCAMSGEWNELLEKVREATNSNKAFFILWNAPKKQMVKYEMVTNFSYDPSLIESYLNRFGEDPWHHYSQSILEGEVTAYSEIIPINEIEHLSIYKDIFVPMKSYHCLGAIVVRDGTHDGYIALNKGDDEEPYNDGDLKLLKLITPHLRKAARIYTELKHSENNFNVLNAIADNTTSGMLICDETRHIVSLNKVAREIITRNRKIESNIDEFNISVPYLNSKMGSVIESSCFPYDAEVDAQPVILLDESGDDMLNISVTPLRREYFGAAIGRGCCLITLTPGYALNWYAIEKEFHLTKRELELIKLIHKRNGVDVLAEVMDIKLNTVRTHIQNIYRKLGVKNQMDLMVKLGSFRGCI
ncbi:helix-turn-helix transcriptional regulator [Agarivorans sp. 1_MG-2023]|uniref:helix-turn-helix transcriptional regulator n=1 Tax=Agarivorans sp. 1_MG-2023 TaxID=3062634 RepID=UPI0026E40E8D|nr:helix-turn-helix transcriptional regulator [Agarivorans sp. 1_MG-2023]MDO6762359.1 helix-turn-helix transcriptional regulator [Agarivorans sp. 1_MG-2023]